MAVVYCAITGIYEMFDRRSASEALATLGDYAEQISEIVKPWGGQINHISGQSIVAVLAAPLAEGNLESHAVSAALAIQRRVAEFNRARAETNDPVAQAAIGVSTAGILVTGATNAFERYLNAMLNDGINVAGTLAALSLQSAGHPVMINHTTYIGVRNRGDITPTSVGQRKLRGRAEPSEVYSVVFGVPPLAPANILAITGKTERTDPRSAG
jgi:class 3 adenylate cyclase